LSIGHIVKTSGAPFWRHVVPFLLLVLVAYLLGFGWIEHRRVRRGPWEVTFTNIAGVPAIAVQQPALQLTNVVIRFTGTTAPPDWSVTVHFEAGRAVPFELPAGKCVFVDALFLPGTVVCEVFGHEIQLMPRALTVDGVAHPWRSGAMFELPVRKEANPPPEVR
jgi:hypothetical protein